MESKYGICSKCNIPLDPVWFTETEYNVEYGIRHKTGRKRKAVDYLICPNCLSKVCVDDSFDRPWR